ncbi:MAG TPA: BlaI/MecI/CopY family transcriptional regulator [Bryobacteraceae bacterium]|nr:BlaI/MecI/CopY family transcriptional regulator [Bryobacteraceae bacterium]
MRRPAASRDMPPPLELECLKTLWSLGEGTVRQVREAIGGRKLAYTTVMTLLDRLEKRGSVTRVKRSRSFVYAPKISREEMRQLAVRDLLDRFFDSNPEALAPFLKPPETPSGEPGGDQH